MDPTLRSAGRLLAELPRPVSTLLLIVAVVLATWAAHRIVTAVLARAAARTATMADDAVLRRLRRPTRYLLIGIALLAAQPGLGLRGEVLDLWRRTAGLVMPALLGWTVIGLLGAGLDIILARADISVADNLRARRRRTRASILYRLSLFVVLLITFCLMLMSIPTVRSIGVTLIASAGLAALAVGAAAQPALKNLIAGLQMVFTEPIRLDDVVIIDGEWGRIEDIRLTYVVVRIWDERRLVVPVSRFLEQSFQNWTRETSQLLGSVFWYVDPAADVPRIRAALEQAVRASALWDGRFFNLQVTDTKSDGSIELRGLMTARDASTAFDLRCEIREAVLAFLRAEMPEAILRRRVVLADGEQMAEG